MTTPSIALQKAIRERLIGTAALTALVPAANVFDRHGKPERFPCCIIGDGQTVLESHAFNRRFIRVFHDTHFWTEATDLFGVKQVADIAMTAINATFPTIADFDVLEFAATGIRTLRDPSGEHGHAILTIEALVRDAT